MSYREHFRLQEPVRPGRSKRPKYSRYAGRNNDDRARGNSGCMDDVDRRPDTVAALAGNAIGWLKPLIARAGAIIDGESVKENAPTPQDVVDRLMKR